MKRRLALAFLSSLGVLLAGCPAAASLSPDGLHIGIEIGLEDEEPSIEYVDAEVYRGGFLDASVPQAYPAGYAYSWHLDGAVLEIASGKTAEIYIGADAFPGVHALTVFVGSGEVWLFSAQSRFTVLTRE